MPISGSKIRDQIPHPHIPPTAVQQKPNIIHLALVLMVASSVRRGFPAAFPTLFLIETLGDFRKLSSLSRFHHVHT